MVEQEKNSTSSQAESAFQAPKSAAIAFGVFEAMFAAFWDPKRRVEEREAEVIVVNRHGKRVARLNTSGLGSDEVEALKHRFTMSENLTFHRLFRWLMARVAEANQDSTKLVREIEVEGGLTAVAEQMDLKSGKATEELRTALKLLQHVELPLPDGGPRPLLSFSEEKPGRGKRSKLIITVDDALLPSYVSTMGKAPSERVAKRMIPVPQKLPPLQGHQSSHGPQAALQMIVLQEMREQANTIATEDYAVITSEMWAKMLDRAGVPKELEESIIVHWIGTEGPVKAPFLWCVSLSDEEVPGSAYSLGDAFTAEHHVIYLAGRKQVRGAQARSRSLKNKLK